MLIIFVIFSTTALLITPFVMIYTNNINDVNYYQPLFGILMVIGEAIYLIKIPHTDLAYSANRFKDITKHAYIEAILNIVVSILFVKKFGLCGVAFGTIIGMLYRLVFHVVYLKYEILKRNIMVFLKKFIFFVSFSAIGILCCYFVIPKVKFNIINWIYHGFIYICINLVVILIGSLIFYKKELLYLKEYIITIFNTKERWKNGKNKITFKKI